MTNQTFVPVTEAQAVQTNIEHSVKIGKQVMKQQLKKAISIAEATCSKEQGNASALATLFELKFTKEADSKIRMFVSNDGELTRFRNLWTKFSRFCETDCTDGFNKFTSNWDMVQGNDAKLEAKKLLCISQYATDSAIEKKQAFILGGSLEIQVELNIADKCNPEYDRNAYVEDLEPMGFGLDICFSKGVIEAFHAANEANETASTTYKQLNKLKNKLKNIDEVTEEMEAQLLVNELNKTDQGKASLAIASQLVSGMLGSTPELLDLSKGS